MSNITAANVQVGHTILGDYTEGIVRRVSDNGLEVEWCDGSGNDYLTWEEVTEQGFSFR